MRKFVFATALAMLVPAAGRAGIAYTYVTDSSSYTIAAGGTQTVNLYLQESLTGGATSLIAADGGLVAAGASITLTNGSTAALQSYQSTVNIAGFSGTAFGGTATRYGNDGSVNGTTAATNNPLQTAFGVTTANGVGGAGVTTDANGRILIGSVTITGLSAGTNTFTLSNYPPPGQTSGNTITTGTSIGPLDLDYTNNIANGNTTPSNPPYFGTLDPANPFFSTESFTVAVSAVPEPSSMALCGLVVLGGAYSCYRRRKAKAAEVVAQVPAVA